MTSIHVKQGLVLKDPVAPTRFCDGQALWTVGAPWRGETPAAVGTIASA